MGAYFRIYRPLNLFLIALAQFLCAYFLDRRATWDTVWTGDLHWLLLGTAACAAFGYWVNDLLDIRRDAINKAEPSLVSELHPFLVYGHIVVLAILALVCGVLMSMWFLKLFLLTLLLLFAYSRWLKNIALAGNVVIALLSFYSVFAVYVLIPEADIQLVLYFSVIAGVVTLCRELVKDAEDVHGDEATGGNTFAVVAGLPNTSLLVYGLVIFLLPILLVALYLQRVYFSPPLLYIYYIYAIAFIIIPLFKVAIDVRQVDSSAGFHTISNLLKYVFYTGILSMVFF